MVDRHKRFSLFGLRRKMGLFSILVFEDSCGVLACLPPS